MNKDTSEFVTQFITIIMNNAMKCLNKKRIKKSIQINPFHNV